MQSVEKAAASFCSERVDGGMFHIFSKFALAVVQERRITICVIIHKIVWPRRASLVLLTLLDLFLDVLGEIYWLSDDASTTFIEREVSLVCCTPLSCLRCL